MATDITALKNRIRSLIKQNDNQEITGPVMQEVLLDIVDELNDSIDETAQGYVNTEAATRLAADQLLANNIQNEQLSRVAADEAEAEARAVGDTRLSAMLGYYVCDTAAGTATKTISAFGYVLTNGGCIRIKMTNANTANNVTLNINSTGAKALYYDGAQASSSNSWEAGDILEVFYDGTQYQCASGGSGKFATGEKVKDVSISNIIERNGNALITNGGVYGLFSQYDNSYNSSAANIAGILKWDGTIGAFNNWYTSPKISIVGAASIVATGLYYSASTYMGFALYDENDAVLYRNTGASISISLADYPTTSYMRFCRSTQTVSIIVRFDPFIAQITAAHVQKGNKMPVSSDAVYQDVWSKFVSETQSYSAITSGTILNASGNVQSFSNFSTSDFIAVLEDCVMTTSGLYPNNSTYHGLHFYDENKNSSQVQPPEGGVSAVNFADYPTVKYIRFSGQTSGNPSVTIKQGEDLLAEMEEMIPAVAKIERLFDLTDQNLGIVQSLALGNNLGTNFTTPDSAVTKAGFIETITINVQSAGNVHIGIGKLDQSLIPVLSKEIDITATSAGLNTIDISERRVQINVGEQLFFMYRAQDGVKFKYTISADSADEAKNCPYGPMTGFAYYSISGRYLLATLAYKVMYIDSVFALKTELEEANARIKMLEANNFVYDDQRTPYKLRVVNGEVVPLAQVFSKVVALGNSLTWHEYKPSIGWYGRDRSMASTTDAVSWTNLLERILKKKNPSAEVTGVATNMWERAGDGNRNVNNIPNVKAQLDAKLSADTDLIIFRAGENGTVNSAEVYTGEILALIDYCLAISPRATVVMCGLFWPNATKDAAILAAANERGYTYITAGKAFSSYQELHGDFMVDTDDGVEKMIGRACLTHTADRGFYLWANHVAQNIGYTSYVLDELYQIEINSSLNGGYKIKDKQSPYQALVTILVYEATQPTISVVDALGNTIQTSVHAISDVGTYTYAFTFIQPDSDVTVTLS